MSRLCPKHGADRVALCRWCCNIERGIRHSEYMRKRRADNAAIREREAKQKRDRDALMRADARARRKQKVYAPTAQDYPESGYSTADDLRACLKRVKEEFVEAYKPRGRTS